VGDLARTHLIEVAPGTSDRWRMHDLVRLYAQRLPEKDPDSHGHDQAIDRLLNYCVKMATAADDQLRAVLAD